LLKKPRLNKQKKEIHLLNLPRVKPTKQNKTKNNKQKQKQKKRKQTKTTFALPTGSCSINTRENKQQKPNKKQKQQKKKYIC